MEEFRELVLLLKSYGADEHIEVYDSTSIKQIPFWANGLSKNGHLNLDTFCLHPQNGQFKTQALPASVRQRLWNTLLFLDSTQEDTYEPERVAYLCWQRLAVLKTLMGAGAVKSLRNIAESILHSAKTYELTTIVIEAAAQLRQFCALHDGNMLAFEKYSQLIEQYERYLQAEQAAEDEYCAFLLLQQQASANPQVLIDQAQRACNKLEPYTETCSSVSFLTNHYFLKLQVAFLEGNWEQVVQIGSQAEQVLGRKSVCSPAKIGAFALSKALGQANLGHLEAALKTLCSAIATENMGTANWYRLQELKLTWLLHLGEYTDALELLKSLNLKSKYASWPLKQKRLYNSILLTLGDLEQVAIQNRLKGILMANCLSFRSVHLPELDEKQMDVQAALLLVQLPKCLSLGISAQLAVWFQEYLVLSGACAPHTQRLELLIEALQQIHAGQSRPLVLQACLEKFKRTPLDYSSPEAAPEILNLESIVKICMV